MYKKISIFFIWIIIFIFVDSIILRGIFHLGYPVYYTYNGSARDPKPYFEFMREGMSTQTSLDKENFFKDAKKGDIKVVFFGGSTGEVLSSKLFQEKLSKYFAQPVSFLNLSCISANHRQHLHMILEVLPKYNPDIIIFYGGYNETVQGIFYDPRPGYPFNFFYKGEVSSLGKFLVEYSALFGALEYKYNIFSPLEKLKAEYNPLSPEWNKSIEDKYFETIYLSKKVSEVLKSDKYGHTRFIAFYQPYQIREIPEFANTNKDIRNRIKKIDYIYDIYDAYSSFGDGVWDDICHVKKNSGANEYIIDLMSKIVANKYNLKK